MYIERKNTCKQEKNISTRFPSLFEEKKIYVYLYSAILPNTFTEPQNI